MSESQTSTQTWLSVSQAAAVLGISERTARRMCESGKLAASVENGDNGGRVWRVDRAAISEQNAQRAATLRSDRAAKDESVRPQFERKNERAAISRINVRPQRAAKNESVRPSENALLIVEKDARIADLREVVESQKLQIEAANRQAAEATAALREYLKLQAKALPSPDQLEQFGTDNSAANARANLREGRQGAPQMPATGKVSPETKTGGRGEGLRDLRSILKTLFGLR